MSNIISKVEIDPCLAVTKVLRHKLTVLLQDGADPDSNEWKYDVQINKIWQVDDSGHLLTWYEWATTCDDEIAQLCLGLGLNADALLERLVTYIEHSKE